MSDYPGAVDSFTTKVDNVNDIMAADVNELQAAIVAVETELGVDPAGTDATVVARLDRIDGELGTDPAGSDADVAARFDRIEGDVGIHGLTVKDTPVDADEFSFWDSVASALKKLTWANLKAGLKTYFDTLYNPVSGWIAAGETWTYASAGTFTVAGDVTAKYKKGTRIKLTQTTVKQMVCYADATYSAPDTTVYVTGGSDFTLANAAITLPFYSYGNPPDFQMWFTWAPTQAGFSSDPANGVYQFMLIGTACTLVVRQPTAGTSNATTFTVSIPIVALTLTNVAWSAMGFGTDAGALLTAMGFIVSGGTVLTLYKNLSATGWTNSGNKYINAITITYGI